MEQGATESLLVRAEDNLLPYLTTEVQGGVLSMRTAGNVDLRETRPIEFFLTVVDLDRFEFTGVGDAELQDLVLDDLVLRSSGIGTVRLSRLDAARLDVQLSGIGSVSANGVVGEQIIRVGEFGDYEAAALPSLVTTVTLTGSGAATVNVRDRLDATILSIGSVYYLGDPVLTTSISGTGRVVKIG